MKKNPQSALETLRTQYPRLDSSIKRVYGAALGEFVMDDERTSVHGDEWVCPMERGNVRLLITDGFAMLVAYNVHGRQRLFKRVEL